MLYSAVLAAIGLATYPTAPRAESSAPSLEAVLRQSQVVVLADVKHGVGERVDFYASRTLFEALVRAGVRHVAIEMPRVLGRQAMRIETEREVAAFAGDVLRAGRWHFVDPDHPGQETEATQYRIASALGRQVLLAKELGLNPIFYDFNNPLGGFRTHNDPVYRCLANLDPVTWVKYGLDSKVTKAERDAAMMRERFSHDDELAQFIVESMHAKGGGKLVVIPGYAHAVMPGGLADRLETRLGTPAQIVAVLAHEAEAGAFHDFLWQQSRLLSIDLSRPPHYRYAIATGTLQREPAPGRYVALDGTPGRTIPSVCHQLAHSPDAPAR